MYYAMASFLVLLLWVRYGNDCMEIVQTVWLYTNADVLDKVPICHLYLLEDIISVNQYLYIIITNYFTYDLVREDINKYSPIYIISLS